MHLGYSCIETSSIGIQYCDSIVEVEDHCVFIMHFVAQSVGKSGCVFAKPLHVHVYRSLFLYGFVYASPMSTASIVWNLRVRCTSCMRWLHLFTCCRKQAYVSGE